MVILFNGDDGPGLFNAVFGWFSNPYFSRVGAVQPEDVVFYLQWLALSVSFSQQLAAV